MKTFREFLNEDAVKAQKAWQDWMKANPQEFGKGGRFYERGSTEKTTQAAKDFMKGYMKTGKPPAGFEVKSTRVSGQDVRGTRSTQTPPPQQPKTTQTPPRPQQQAPRQQPPQQPSGSTQTPPRGAQAGTQAPPKQPKASTPPPPKPPTRNVPAPAANPTAASPKGPGLRSRLGKLGGTALNVGAGALEYKDRRSAGQSRTQAATGATASAAGGEAGWRTGLRLGSSLGSKLAGPRGAVIGGGIGALSGATLGSTAAGGLADKLTGASKKPTEKDYEKARQKYGVTQSRKVSAQSGTYGAKQGSALTGIGGKTAVSKDKKGAAFMSTGAGSQRKTVQLAKTQLVRDPKTGKQVVGDLAFKGGKATYLARPSVASRDTGLGGAIRNVSRATGIGGQRERDAAAAKQEYRTALKNTQTYQKKLGITPKAATAQKLPGRGVGPAKVGPKLVGPKIVGPKKVGPAKPRNTPGSSVRPV
jgi:hypothetical protein